MSAVCAVDQWIVSGLRCSAACFAIIAILSRRAEILAPLRKYFDGDWLAVAFPSSQLVPEIQCILSSRRQKCTLAIAMWLVICVPYRCCVFQSHKNMRLYFPDHVAYLLVCGSLIGQKWLGEKWFAQIFVATMWVWCYISLVTDNLDQLHEVSRTFGADLPLVLGVCTPFHSFATAYVAYNAFFLYFRQYASLYQLMFVCARTSSMVYFINVLNVASSAECAVKECIRPTESACKVPFDCINYVKVHHPLRIDDSQPARVVKAPSQRWTFM